ncbi:hypothetical protein Hdeb2414_s0936g00964051 [Helianthus debilis subsp. tardiflorus]
MIHTVKRAVFVFGTCVNCVLEEFERAVISSYDKNSTDDTKDRHHDFINAMEKQISRVESSWNDSSVSAGKPPRTMVRLDERERKELALFLSGSKSPGDDRPTQNRLNDEHRERRKQKVFLMCKQRLY